MKVLLQRVKRAEVRVSNTSISQIGKGLLVFIGIEKNDSSEDADYYADKIGSMRIFEDLEGKMNISITEAGGEILVVSQFTLAAATRRGKRPSFDNAAPPERARILYEIFINRLREAGLRVCSGKFQERMEVELINDGPVTFIVDPR